MDMGIAMYIAFLFFVTWIPAVWKRRLVGYGLIMDISCHVVLQTLFGGDAEGRVGMLLAGILINATMHAYRTYCGYAYYGKRRGVAASPDDAKRRWRRVAGRIAPRGDLSA